MKKWKKLLIFVLCLMLMQVPVTTVSSPENVQAATVKKGLKKERGKYYFYVNGKKVKNTWKTVKVKEKGKIVSYRYYFGKNCAAYSAVKAMGSYNNVVVKSIKGKKYGFNARGRMAKGVYVNGSNMRFYAFTKKGIYDPKKNSALRKASKEGADARTLRNLLGKPLKEQITDSCYTDPRVVNDVILTYPNMTVTLGRYADGREIVYGAFPN